MGLDRSLQSVVLRDEDGNVVGVLLDGSVYRVQAITKTLNASGTQINPATQETLAAADTKLGTIDSVLDSIKDTDGIKKITDPLPAGTNNIGDVDVVSSALPTGAATEATLSTRATETTTAAVRDRIGAISASPAANTLQDRLLALATRLGEVSASPTANTVLARLKSAVDTLVAVNTGTGVKIIDDIVRMGDTARNGINSVLNNSIRRLETRSAITSANGALDVAVATDNSINRLQTRSTLVGQVAKTGSEVKVTTIADVDAPSTQHRLQTEARLAPGSTVQLGTGIPSDPAALDIEFVANGGSEDMLVNGSVTPVAFTYGPGAGVVLAVQQLLVVFTADDFEFDGSSFGPNSALTTGIKFETDVDGVVTEIFNIKQNEDFLRVPGRIPLVNNTGPKDVLAAAFGFGGLLKLDGDTSDQIIVTVRDDLTSVKLKYLTATIYGAEE